MFKLKLLSIIIRFFKIHTVNKHMLVIKYAYCVVKSPLPRAQLDRNCK